VAKGLAHEAGRLGVKEQRKNEIDRDDNAGFAKNT
jgi:hypothetical protein